VDAEGSKGEGATTEFKFCGLAKRDGDILAKPSQSTTTVNKSSGIKHERTLFLYYSLNLD
jgi:hypothetical protein